MVAGLIADACSLNFGGDAAEEDGRGVWRGGGLADGGLALVLSGMAVSSTKSKPERADVEGERLVIVAGRRG